MSKQLSCIIIEDEPLATEKLLMFIDKVSYLKCMGTFENGLEAMNYNKLQEVDLFFLDIQMKELNGIDFLQSVRANADVIITSAYRKYALDGYNYNVSGYLLKPFSFTQFLNAVNKVKRSETKIEQSYIFIKSDNKLIKLNLDEILLIKSMADYLMIYTESKNMLTLMSFKQLMELLPQSRFIRVHNSYVISIQNIVSVETNTVFLGKHEVPISTKYKSALLSELKKA